MPRNLLSSASHSCPTPAKKCARGSFQRHDNGLRGYVAALARRPQREACLSLTTCSGGCGSLRDPCAPATLRAPLRGARQRRAAREKMCTVRTSRRGNSNGFALAANDCSQCHHGHGVQAFAANMANGFALAANDRSQCHHGHGAQAEFAAAFPTAHGSPTTATHGTHTADRIQRATRSANDFTTGSYDPHWGASPQWHARPGASLRRCALPKATHWLQTTAASGTTATASKLLL